MAKQEIEVSAKIQQAIRDLAKVNEALFKNTDSIKAVNSEGVRLQASKSGQKYFADLRLELTNGTIALQKFVAEYKKATKEVSLKPLGTLRLQNAGTFVGPPRPSPAQMRAATIQTFARTGEIDDAIFRLIQQKEAANKLNALAKALIAPTTGFDPIKEQADAIRAAARRQKDIDLITKSKLPPPPPPPVDTIKEQADAIRAAARRQKDIDLIERMTKGPKLPELVDPITERAKLLRAESRRQKDVKLVEAADFVGPPKPPPKFFKELEKDAKAAAKAAEDLGKKIVEIQNKGAAPPKSPKVFADLFDDPEGKAKRFTLSLSEITRTLEALTIRRAFNALANTFEEGISSALKYQIAISEIRTISQSAQLTNEQWASSIRKVSDQLGLPIADVAEATYQALSNQVVKSTEAFDFLRQTGEFARVTQTNLTTAVNLTSSALNSYGLSSKSAGQIQAELFKAVELGRFRVEDIANTYGRATVLAEDLGVSLQEVAAAYATLTVKGLTAADAGTFVTNVFQKLSKPTERLQKVLNEFGTPTGKLAVATFGFAPLIEKLAELDRAGNINVAEVFNEIRGRKGFAGLTRVAGEFDETLKKITNSFGDFQNAVKIRAESPADFLIKEVNKLKNVAIQDFGQPILKAVADVIKGFKSFSGELGDTTAQLSVGTIKTAVFTGGLILLGTKAVSAGRALVGLGAVASLSKLTPVALGISATAAAILALRELSNQTIEAGSNFARLEEQSKKIKVGGGILEGEFGEGRFKAAVAAIDDLNKRALSGLADNVKIVNDGVRNTQLALKIINEELSIQQKTYTDTIKDSINDLSASQTKIKTLLSDQLKRTADFRKEGADAIFSRQLEVATPLQRLQLQAGRINQLKAEATKLLTTTTGDPLQDAKNADIANEKLKEVRALMQENFKLQVDMVKAANPGRQIVVSTIELRRQDNDLIALQIQLNEKNRTIQQKNLEDLKTREKAEKERLARVQQAGKLFTDFAILDAEGKVKTQFQEPKTGAVDFNKVLVEFNRVARDFREAIGTDQNAQFALLQAFESKKTALIVEAQQLRAKTLLDFEQKSIIERAELNKKALNDLRKSALEASNIIFGDQQSITRLGVKEGSLQSLSQFNISNISGSLADASRKIAGFFNKDIAQNTEKITKAQQDAASAITEAQLALDRAQKRPLLVDGVKTIDETELQNLRARIETAIAAVQQNIKLQAGPGLSEADLLKTTLRKQEGGQTPPLQTVVEDLRAQLDAIEKARQVIEEARTKRQEQVKQQSDLEQKLKQLIPNFENAAVQLQATKEVGTSTFDSIAASVERVNEAMNRLNQQVKSIDLEKLRSIRMGAPAAPQEPFIRQATGGVIGIGMHPGGPYGTDTVPAWLTPGERVLSVMQNRDYERMIAQRTFAPPRYYSQGSSSIDQSTRVGDIVINAPQLKTQKPGQIARSVQRLISRRGLRG